MNLDDWRGKIDEIDDKLVRLIAERIRIASEIGKKKNEQKKQAEDRAREKVVMDNVSRIAREENINAEDIAIIYQEIIAASKRIQGIEVAYHGESGAFNEEAIFQFFKHAVSARSFEKMEDVFKLVEEGRIPFGMIPIENSREGSVGNSYDLLLETDVKVYGEVEQRPLPRLHTVHIPTVFPRCKCGLHSAEPGGHADGTEKGMERNGDPPPTLGQFKRPGVLL